MDNKNLGIAIVYVLCMVIAAIFAGAVNAPQQQVIHLQVIMPDVTDEHSGFDPLLINPIYRPGPDDLNQAEPCLVAISPGSKFRGSFFKS